MGVSILEVIEAGGYDLTTEEDARWLLSKSEEFEQLLDDAQELVDAVEEKESAEAERKYQERFGND